MKKVIRFIFKAIVAVFGAITAISIGFGAGIAAMVRKNCSEEAGEKIDAATDAVVDVIEEKLFHASVSSEVND